MPKKDCKYRRKYRKSGAFPGGYPFNDRILSTAGAELYSTSALMIASSQSLATMFLQQPVVMSRMDNAALYAMIFMLERADNQNSTTCADVKSPQPLKRQMAQSLRGAPVVT